MLFRSCGLVLLAAAFALKDFSQIFGVDVHGLSPSKNFIPLFDDPTRERFYLMFQWGHLYDYLYGWTMRSWIFWPLIGWSILLFGWRSLMKPERFFLLLYTLAFTFFTITWHPNLGIHQDWDLYAIESAPCLLLLATYLPDLVKIHFRRVAILIPMLTSLLIGYEQLHREAHFGTRGCGNLKCVLSEKIPCQINLNGHLKKLNNMGIREGVYEGRLRNVRHMRSHFFYAVVPPNRETTVFFHVGAQEGRGGPDRYLDETMTKLRLSADDAFEQ